MIAKTLLWTALLLGAACTAGDSQPRSKQPDKNVGESDVRQNEPSSCEGRAEALGRKLRQQATYPAPMSWHEQPMPSAAIGSTATMRGPVVLIDDNTLFYSGQSLASARELGEQYRLDRWVDQNSYAKPGDTHQETLLYLHATPTTTLARLALVAKDLPPEQPLALLVSAKREAYINPLADAPTRARSIIETILKSPNAAQRAAQLAEELQGAIGMCVPIIKLFGEVATLEASRKSSFIAENISQNLQSCDCAVADFEIFKHIMLAFTDPGESEQRYVRVSLDGVGTVVEQPATASVSDLVAAITALPRAKVDAGIAVKLKK